MKVQPSNPLQTFDRETFYGVVVHPKTLSGTFSPSMDANKNPLRCSFGNPFIFDGFHVEPTKSDFHFKKASKASE